MAEDTQPSPRMDVLDRLVGWCIIVALVGTVTLWAAFILAHIPHQIVLPSWVVATLIVIGVTLAIIASGGLFIAYLYLRRLAHRQQGRE